MEKVLTALKKIKSVWSVSQEDITNHQVLIFLCLFYPGNTQLGYHKQTVITGFVPTNQLDFPESKTYLTPSSLLYAGGLNWYLQSLGGKQNDVPIIDEKMMVETIHTLPSDHPQKEDYW